MIVDCHTQVWASPEQLGGLADALLPVGNPAPETATAAHHAATANVSATLVLGLRCLALNAEIPNAYVAEYVRSEPHRLVGFAGVDPTDLPRALDELDQAVEAGLQGAVISPAMQGFHPTDSRAMRFYDACLRRRMPVFFDCAVRFGRLARMEFARPAMVDEVARDLPDLRLVIAHVGHPWHDEALVLLAKHQNVLADISGLLRLPWAAYHTLVSASELGVMDKLLFGSDFPRNTPQQAVETLFAIHQMTAAHLPSPPREALRGIVERDAVGLLGLRLAPPPPGLVPVGPGGENEGER